METLLTKPLLRGYVHLVATFISLIGCFFLIAQSTTKTTLVASLVYSFGLLFMFGISATYHCITWQPQMRSLLKRIDHCAIFLLIAGTTTPIALLALPESAGENLLLLIWAAALVGILQSIFWVSAPKWFTALICIAAGWLSFPYFGLFNESLSLSDRQFLIAGGVFYSIGALFYAFKKPNILPGVFGYHELFHLFTVIAAALHFNVIYNLVGK